MGIACSNYYLSVMSIMFNVWAPTIMPSYLQQRHSIMIISSCDHARDRQMLSKARSRLLDLLSRDFEASYPHR